jgi:GTP-binding protein HflX
LELLNELRLLAQSCGLDVLDCVTGTLRSPHPAHFAGSGKIEEVATTVSARGAELVVFDHDLSAVQVRNLSRAFKCRVVDRTELILDIFAQRAQSHEGKLQVELAQLERLSSRLVHEWTHLERQKGGIGLRGPGEKQLETDRRLLGLRIKTLRRKLTDLRGQRQVQRRSRVRGEVFSVSLVGYTNAGKSTLFSALTGAESYAADQLFATLDTKTRRLFSAGISTVTISDTVGFIRGLPHTLVEAFRATLEETTRADLLLHVIDSASSDRDEQMDQVNHVLQLIGAGDVPQIEIFNKIDLSLFPPQVHAGEHGSIPRLHVSARTGEGLDKLRTMIVDAARRSRSSPRPAPISAEALVEPEAATLQPQDDRYSGVTP